MEGRGQFGAPDAAMAPLTLSTSSFFDASTTAERHLFRFGVHAPRCFTSDRWASTAAPTAAALRPFPTLTSATALRGTSSIATTPLTPGASPRALAFLLVVTSRRCSFDLDNLTDKLCVEGAREYDLAPLPELDTVAGRFGRLDLDKGRVVHRARS